MITFVVDKFVDENVPNELAIIDAVSNITALLEGMDLKYKTNWEFDSSGYTSDGKKVLYIEFKDAGEAMLARLNGLANG